MTPSNPIARRWLVPISCILIAAVAWPAIAAGKPLELKTERVIVFKDGYSLVVKRGTATTDADGEFYTEQVPDSAVLGSFWAVPDEGRLVSLRAGWDTTKEEIEKDVPCTETIEILKANQGKHCKVELSDKSNYSGVIQAVLVQETDAPVSAPLHRSLNLSSLLSSRAMPRNTATANTSGDPSSSRTETISGIAGTKFVLRGEEGDVLLPIDQVRTLTIGSMKTALKRTVTVETRSKRLTFRFAEPNKKRQVLVMYFRPGLRWIPTYRIALSDDEKQKKAQVAMQAEIINEAEDLVDVPIDIVVGVPNFRFRNAPSPLILERTLRNALNQAAPQLMNNFRNDLSNALLTQRVAAVRPPARRATGESAVELPAELTAAGKQDLFVYNLPDLKLLKGERAAVGILKTEVPYRDVYTWNLHVKRKDIEAAPSGSGVGSPLVLSKNEVWHQIVLTNNTKLPWTTGAAMIMQGNQPLAQELLTYTSPGSVVRVPVTVSVDTRGAFAENETARELKSLTWDHHSYAKITKEAKLDLHNYKSIPIETEITVRLGGRVVDASHDGSITLSPFNPGDWENYRGSSAVNNSSTVRWTTTLKPGESFRPTVKYYYYTRH